MRNGGWLDKNGPPCRYLRGTASPAEVLVFLMSSLLTFVGADIVRGADSRVRVWVTGATGDTTWSFTCRFNMYNQTAG